MKKLWSFFLSVILSSLILTGLMAQVIPPPELKTFKKEFANPWQHTRGFMNCDPLALYGQEPYTQTIVGVPSVMLGGYAGTLAIDNIPESVDVIGGLTFWGSFIRYDLPCIPEVPVDFKILLFDYEMEMEFVPNQVIDVTSSGQMEMMEDIAVFRFDIVFPEPVDVTQNRLISIAQYFDPMDFEEGDEEMPCIFSWLGSDQGDLQSVLIGYQFGEITEIFPVPIDFSFCIRQPGTAIPVRNWALLVALALMVSIILFRYRYYVKS